MYPEWNQVSKIVVVCVGMFAAFTFAPHAAPWLFYILAFSCAYYNIKNFADRNPKSKELAKEALVAWLRKKF